jgi:hypothetical protein
MVLRAEHLEDFAMIKKREKMVENRYNIVKYPTLCPVTWRRSLSLSLSLSLTHTHTHTQE